MSVVEKIKPALKIAGAGAALGLLKDLGVVTVLHREETHRSVETSPWLKKAVLRLVSIYAPEDYIWPAVHRDHHRNSDVNRYPFWRITMAHDWIKEHPEESPVKIDDIPTRFKHLDPVVKSFPLDDVLYIGHDADGDLRERLGARYEEEKGRSAQEYTQLFDPKEDQFTYSKQKHKKGTPYTQDEVARIVLEDPHSPILTGWKNGVRAILLNNVERYQVHAHAYRDEPDLKPKDLQDEAAEAVDHVKTRVRAFTESTLLLAALVHLHRSGYNPKEALRRLSDPKDVATALAVGATIETTSIGVMLFGGNVTNSYGHAAQIDPEGLKEATLSDTFRMKLNPESGTASTNLVNGGIGGKILSAGSLDEVGNQYTHHIRPDLIAYTLLTGLKGLVTAPLGKGIEFMAKSPLFPFIKEGKGFPGVAFEDRPDMASKGGRLIEQRRMEQEKVLQAV